MREMTELSSGPVFSVTRGLRRPDMLVLTPLTSVKKVEILSRTGLLAS